MHMCDLKTRMRHQQWQIQNARYREKISYMKLETTYLRSLFLAVSRFDGRW